MKDFNCHTFMSQSLIEYEQNPQGQRYGQYMVNKFSKLYPDVVIPQDCDCFYDNRKINDFLSFICSLTEG